MEGSDKDEIDAKTQALAEAASKLAEKAYSANADEGAPDPVDANASAQSNPADDVVDAEFEEVKEDDKK
jgi:molecular chaperone DnaK